MTDQDAAGEAARQAQRQRDLDEAQRIVREKVQEEARRSGGR